MHKTGKAVANPSNFLVRMGTPISALIEAAGGIPEDTGKIIGGVLALSQDRCYNY